MSMELERRVRLAGMSAFCATTGFERDDPDNLFVGAWWIVPEDGIVVGVKRGPYRTRVDALQAVVASVRNRLPPLYADLREKSADRHEKKGGNRQAYVHGWDHMNAGGGLFQGLMNYETDLYGNKSFGEGFHDADAALESCGMQ